MMARAQRAELRTVLQDGERFACPIAVTLTGYDLYVETNWRERFRLGQSLHESGLGHTKYVGFDGGRLRHPRSERLDRLTEPRSVWGMSLAPEGARQLFAWSYRPKPNKSSRRETQIISLEQLTPASGLDVWIGPDLDVLEPLWEQRYDVVRGWLMSDWTRPVVAIVIAETLLQLGETE